MPNHCATHCNSNTLQKYLYILFNRKEFQCHDTLKYRRSVQILFKDIFIFFCTKINYNLCLEIKTRNYIHTFKCMYMFSLSFVRKMKSNSSKQLHENYMKVGWTKKNKKWNMKTEKWKMMNKLYMWWKHIGHAIWEGWPFSRLAQLECVRHDNYNDVWMTLTNIMKYGRKRMLNFRI